MSKINDIINVKITSLDNHGHGIAKVSGVTLFIPKSLPDDNLSVKITKLKKNYGSAEILKMITPSSNRINPICNDFKKGCGGCHWLNLKYSEELFWKTRLVRDIFKNKARINVKVLPIIEMEKPSKYRNKLSLLNINGKLGFMKENSKQMINFDFCYQELEQNQEIYNYLKNIKFDPAIKQVHVRSNNNKQSLICFYVDEINDKIKKLADKIKNEIDEVAGFGLLTKSGYKNIYGEEFIIEEINNIKYQIPNNSFFQTNYRQSRLLQNTVKKLLNPMTNERIIDLYCGVGFFTLYIAKFCNNMIGIENNELSVKYAEQNALLNKITNANFFLNDVGNKLKIFKTGSVHSMILDPPRSGCEKNVLDEIARIKPKKIIYISCYMDSLIRDLKVLINTGYKPEICQPIDMFPRTYHVENVVSLVKI